MGTKFIQVGDRYLIKDSNSIYVSEKEMKKIIEDEKKGNANIKHESVNTDVKQETNTTTK